MRFLSGIILALALLISMIGAVAVPDSGLSLRANPKAGPITIRDSAEIAGEPNFCGYVYPFEDHRGRAVELVESHSPNPLPGPGYKSHIVAEGCTCKFHTMVAGERHHGTGDSRTYACEPT
ncbi:hypothetical protein K458DRAFT_399876 [Lentithecium fluviatile CBS 122367]|uniref:Uncharacterized protein n=1 Tax=Lentithecium fluviatile CBS 122367 TaxID=1168545 RepID=A0A6G1JEQ8_9PLEO|nr:hypothetical protein K458DRAFT_399876 [Lentithecium fluviatile CBS 122367]